MVFRCLIDMRTLQDLTHVIQQENTYSYCVDDDNDSDGDI